jgi:adenylate cyclase
MGEDEAGTLARLRAHRRELIDPKVTEHKGRIVKTTGDGILIEFPSVVEAVASAIAVQRGMAERNATAPQDQRIELRVGINSGDVIVEDGDIHGDGVNVAARLEALAEPGGICLSAIVRDQVEGRLDCVFEDLGEPELKNIARRVRVYRVVSEQRRQAPAISLPLPDKPSIAVLPFQNMSGDPEQEYFVDGMVEEIITAVSRYPSLFVIARNSSSIYKGRTVEVRQVGRELGVRYVLEGSLRKVGNRIRVTAQLVEAETGNHVWAERYDRNLADIFAVQDEITEAVTVAVAPAIAEAELQRVLRKPPASLDAWAAYLRGLWHLNSFTSEDCEDARRYFEQAISLEPAFSGSYSGLALTRLNAAITWRLGSRHDALEAAGALVRHALQLDSNDAEARAMLSYVLQCRGDLAGALTEAERSLAMNPNLPRGYNMLGSALIFAGRAEEGVAVLERGARHDPHGRVGAAARLNFEVIGLYFSHRYEAAIATADLVIRSSPGFPTPYRYLAAALGQLGRLEEAKEALSKAIAVMPGAFERAVRDRGPQVRPEDHEHMLDGLRKAGWDGDRLLT